jgi:hypothetical protein
MKKLAIITFLLLFLTLPCFASQHKALHAVDNWSSHYTKYDNSEKNHAEFTQADKKAMVKPYASGPVKVTQGKASYHGNRKSYKFHRSSCRYYDCKNCTKIFNSRKAAINAGYIACKVCRP